MLLLLTVLSGMVHAEAPANTLATSFQNPPASARPHTWWHWMDGNITKEGITTDLRAMKSAGIGGAHIFDVGQGVPSGPIVYNSQEWRDLMVHALREAKKLGLDMTMHNCAGWSSSAGPWVKPEDAMKKLVFATSTLQGAGKPTLPKTQINGGYYRDIAIQVLPTRQLPGKSSLGTLTGLGANPGPVTSLDWPAIDSATSIPLDRIQPDGTLDVDLPSGDWTILRMGETLTGAQNVASRDSGRGLEVDKLSAASLDRFLEGGLRPLMDQLGTDSSLHTVLIDSYETGYNNWTSGLLHEFATRRGYDPTPYLPALAGYVVDTPERTLGFLFDYRRTIAELWAKNYSGHFAQRLKERGLNLAIEPYGNGNFDPFTFGKPANLKFGKGSVVWGKSVGDVLKGVGVTPDFSTATKGVRAIHRRIGEMEAYFVASTQPYPHSATAKFRTSAKNVRVELWHPETGQIEEAPVWRQIPGGVEVPLELESDGSVFVMITPTNRQVVHLTSTKASPAVVKKQVEPPLRIIKAVYGDASSGKTIDVTAIVAAAAGPHSVRIAASNTDMGGDPAFNIVKNLVVTYQLGDEVKTVVIRENAKLEIGNLPNSGTPPVFEVRGRNAHVWQNGDFTQSWSNGRSVRFQVKDVPQPVGLKGPWTLKFPAGWDTPETATYNKLESWTESKNFGIKHFSGTVAYSAEFGLSRAQLQSKDRLYLDLGDVRELCRIRLNGKLVATQWKPPFRVDITGNARVGQNTLEVEVTNLWVNRLIGDEQFPDDMGWNGSQLKSWPEWFVKGTPRPEPRRKTFTTWRHNYKDTPLLPSGLLGPVMLRWVRVVPLAP